LLQRLRWQKREQRLELEMRLPVIYTYKYSANGYNALIIAHSGQYIGNSRSDFSLLKFNASSCFLFIMLQCCLTSVPPPAFDSRYDCKGIFTDV
jgi:hypothetical protein